jgi:hypothetical protein
LISAAVGARRVAAAAAAAAAVFFRAYENAWVVAATLTF